MTTSPVDVMRPGRWAGAGRYHRHPASSTWRPRGSLSPSWTSPRNLVFFWSPLRRNP